VRSTRLVGAAQKESPDGCGLARKRGEVEQKWIAGNLDGFDGFGFGNHSKLQWLETHFESPRLSKEPDKQRRVNYGNPRTSDIDLRKPPI